MGVSNLDEVVIVTRAKERFEYRRGGHHCCADESNLSQRRYTETYLRISRKEKKITIRQRFGVEILSNLKSYLLSYFLKYYIIYISMKIK